MNKALELELLRVGVLKRVYINKDRIKDVPVDRLYQDTYGKHFVINSSELTNEEINTMLIAQQTNHIKIIKNIIVFFMLISIIGFCAAVYFRVVP